MISTFKWNRYPRKMSLNKTSTHVQEQKKRCRCNIPLTFRVGIALRSGTSHFQ